jgi:hypothetical protein
VINMRSLVSNGSFTDNNCTTSKHRCTVCLDQIISGCIVIILFLINPVSQQLPSVAHNCKEGKAEKTGKRLSAKFRLALRKGRKSIMTSLAPRSEVCKLGM